MTLRAAELLGVAEQLGRIDRGKAANLVIASGDVLQPATQVVGLVVAGRGVGPDSKHTRLYERYRERLREVKEGRAPLGTR